MTDSKFKMLCETLMVLGIAACLTYCGTQKGDAHASAGPQPKPTLTEPSTQTTANDFFANEIPSHVFEEPISDTLSIER